ncbi:DUF6585 family protein [Nocardia anaemiae]|uniref:DUF6585 family protein n=1 Tax=Nocardia anaemiae TaxID=263910 RepID=UPI0007A41ED6|nr:DUF6585 family protein [Nocardia anaemiae]
MSDITSIPVEVAHAVDAAGLGQLIAAFPESSDATGSGVTAALMRASHKASNDDRNGVFVYQNGVIWQRRRKNKHSVDGWETERLDQFRWADIAEFTQSSHRTVTASGFTTTTHSFWFTLRDGRRFDISRDGQHSSKVACFSGLERFAATVDPLVTAAQIPLAEQALQRGEKVGCGLLSVDVNGVYWARNFLAWPDLEEMAFSNGSVVIRKRGKRRKWIAVSTSRVANLSLLLAITRALGAQHGARLP